MMQNRGKSNDLRTIESAVGLHVLMREPAAVEPRAIASDSLLGREGDDFVVRLISHLASTLLHSDQTVPERGAHGLTTSAARAGVHKVSRIAARIEGATKEGDLAASTSLCELLVVASCELAIVLDGLRERT